MSTCAARCSARFRAARFGRRTRRRTSRIVFAHWDMSPEIARRPRPPLRAKIPSRRSRPTLSCRRSRAGTVSGDRAGALEASRALVAAHPDMRIALLQLSHLEREAGNLPAATAALRHALQIHPGDVEAASLLGASLTGANRSDEAIEVLEPYAAASGRRRAGAGDARARAGAFGPAGRGARDAGSRAAERSVECAARRDERHDRADGGIIERRLGRRSRRRSRSIPRPHVRTARSAR